MKKPKADTRTIGANGTMASGNRRDLYHDLYHFLLSLSWPRFLLLLSAAFLLVNLVFGVAYYLLPETDFDGMVHASHLSPFLQCYFFSVQTFATIGYGKMSPIGLMSNIIVTAEAFVGLVSAAVGTGLVFARFARPRARVLISRNIIVTKHDGKRALAIRLSNKRLNQIVDATVGVAFVANETTAEGESFRKIHDLKLRRNRSPVFTLTWSVFHDIDETSPVFGLTDEVLKARRALVAVSLSGIDETLSQTIHARHAYTSEDILWNRKFTDILTQNEAGQATIDLARFHDTEPIPA